MHHIKPLHHLTTAEVADLAHAAAERGEPEAQANPYPTSSPLHAHFAAAYRERDEALRATA